MDKLLLFILQHIVEHPDDVQIVEKQEDQRIVYQIHANQEDIGKIIGKQGRIIRAIRDIAKIVATKRNLFVDVEIIEDTVQKQEEKIDPAVS